MRTRMDFILILTLGFVSTHTAVQASHYSRGFYSSAATPTSHYYHHSGGFVPLTYKSDLIPEETKHRSSSKYYKKPYKGGYNSDEEDTSSERYASEEFGHDGRHSLLTKDNDSHEYTIGTHIRVQHPITVPKKLKASHPTKSTKYTTLPNIGSSYALDVSHENHGGSEYLSSSAKKPKYIKHYEADPFHVIPPPKSTVASHHNHHITQGNNGYDIFDHETESYENSDLNLKHLKGRFNGVASKKQIEQYLEDQEKLLDEALKLQLLSSPKFQKLLKNAEKEQYHHKDIEFEDEYVTHGPSPAFRERFPHGGPPQSQRLRRRPPPSGDFKRPTKSKPVILSKPSRKYRQAYVVEV